MTPSQFVGVDPGLSFPGYALLDLKGRLVSWSVLAAQITNPKSINLSIRCWKVASDLIGSLKKRAHLNTVVGIEGPAYCAGAWTKYEQLARIRQAIADQLIIAFPEIVILEIAPTVVKKSAAGSGRATKEQVFEMMRQEFPTNWPGSKEKRYALADSLAVAVATRSMWKRGVIAQTKE